MKLLLVRHAEAIGGYPDNLRQLSEQGRFDLNELSNKLKPIFNRPDYIFASPFLRTKMSAEILSASLGNIEVLIDKSLKPFAEVWEAIELIKSLAADSIIMVGHMPFVSELCYTLSDVLIQFNTGQAIGLNLEFDGIKLKGKIFFNSAE